MVTPQAQLEDAAVALKGCLAKLGGAEPEPEAPPSTWTVQSVEGHPDSTFCGQFCAWGLAGKSGGYPIYRQMQADDDELVHLNVFLR